MGFFIALGQLLKIIGKVIDLFRETNKVKAAKKKDNLNDILDAAKETNKKIRASRLNMALDDTSRL